MAYWDVDAFLTQARAILDTNAGVQRQVASARFSGDLYESLSDEEASRRGLVAPRFEVRIKNQERLDSGPPITCGVVFYRIEVDVLVRRHLNQDHKLSDTTRDDLRALAWQDGDVVAQALGWPGNFTQATHGIVSGALRYERSDLERFQLGEDEPGLVETTHIFNGVVRVDP